MYVSTFFLFCEIISYLSLYVMHTSPHTSPYTTLQYVTIPLQGSQFKYMGVFGASHDTSRGEVDCASDSVGYFILATGHF